MSVTRRSLFSAAAALALFAAGPALAHDGVHVTDAYARFVPGARTGAIYLTIENHAKVEEHLVSVATDIAGKTQLHQSVQGSDGMMAMPEMTDGLAIAPGAIAQLKSGGDHIMVMDLKTHPKDGDTFTLTLTFSHAGQVKVEVPVRNKP
ncbi:MAG: copper chaperone PCu(A)C [Paracoccaceae bacterium]